VTNKYADCRVKEVYEFKFSVEDRPTEICESVTRSKPSKPLAKIDEIFQMVNIIIVQMGHQFVGNVTY